MRYNEIDIIRFVLIIVLVAFHACCPYYSQTWQLTSGLSDKFIHAYTLVGSNLYNGMLETFAMISGFLFHKALCQPLTIDFWWKKVLRLILPSIIWSTLYASLFLSNIDTYTILNGAGHLWFLPMLFWLFVLEASINHWCNGKIKEKYILIALFLIAIIPYPTLPFRLNTSLYYLLPFHCGVLMCGNINKVQTFFQRIPFRLIVVLTIAAIAATYAKIKMGTPYDEQPIIEKAINILTSTIIRTLGASSIVMVYWKCALYFKNTQKNWISTLAYCSFGIYILQEFILRLLYYNTPFCSYFKDFSPIISTPLTLCVSYIITTILIRIKYIRFLIGN